MRPDRSTMEQMCTLVADAAGVSLDTVLDKHVRRDVFQVSVYLLRGACNLPIKQGAGLDKVSVAHISQIHREIEDSGGLGHAFRWARKLGNYIQYSVDPPFSTCIRAKWYPALGLVKTFPFLKPRELPGRL
ncbi:MAG: hypothetical protein GTO13_16035 [Proteobacteria bacterium]|nr:hypothetical protein [Pseudomonadota bacterium]